MPRWGYICQLCWEVLNSDQHWPSPREYSYEPCGVCGEQALTVAVHPDVNTETKAILLAEATAPWCLHCGSDTCQHINQHNAAYGRAS